MWVCVLVSCTSDVETSTIQVDNYCNLLCVVLD